MFGTHKRTSEVVTLLHCVIIIIILFLFARATGFAHMQSLSSWSLGYPSVVTVTCIQLSPLTTPTKFVTCKFHYLKRSLRNLQPVRRIRIVAVASRCSFVVLKHQRRLSEENILVEQHIRESRCFDFFFDKSCWLECRKVAGGTWNLRNTCSAGGRMFFQCWAASVAGLCGHCHRLNASQESSAKMMRRKLKTYVETCT